MKTLTMLSVFFLSVSCGDENICESGYREVAGLNICDNNFDVRDNEIERAISILEAELNADHQINGLEKVFRDNNVEVVFIEGYMGVECEKNNEIYFCERFTDGLNVNSIINYITYNMCLSRTSLIHELLHSIEALVLSIYDGSNHDTLNFFIQPEQTDGESIEERVMVILMATLDEIRCPRRIR